MIAAIYARKSTKQKTADEEAKSVHRQIANAKKFAASKGWTVDEAHVYADDAISGAHTAKLRNRQRLLDLIASGHAPFNVLIIRDESRFSRRDGHVAFGELMDIAQRGVAIWFYGTGQPFTYGDIGSNTGGFMRSEMAAEYRRQISRWVTEAMHRKAERGHVTGNSTYGYTNVRMPAGHVELQIRPDEAQVVERIFHMVAVQKMGLTRIAKQLNAEQVPIPNPKMAKCRGWGPSSLNNILRRSTYRGVVVSYKTRKQDIGGGRIRAVPRPESEWITRTLPQLRIVSDATWTKAQDQLAANRKRQPAQTIQMRDYESKYLLVGFVRCTCGSGYHVRNGQYACTAHYRKGICPHVYRWNIDAVNRSVMAEILKTFQTVFPTDKVDRLLTGLRKAHLAMTRIDRTALLRQDVAKVDREIARLTEAVASGAGAVKAIVDRLQAANAKQQAIMADLERREPMQPPRSWSAIEQDIRQGLATWREQFFSRDITRQRDLLRRHLTSPIQFRPTVHDNGTVDLHFTGQLGLSKIIEGVLVTNACSPWNSGIDYMPSFSGVVRVKKAA